MEPRRESEAGFSTVTVTVVCMLILAIFAAVREQLPQTVSDRAVCTVRAVLAADRTCADDGATPTPGGKTDPLLVQAADRRGVTQPAAAGPRAAPVGGRLVPGRRRNPNRSPSNRRLTDELRSALPCRTIGGQACTLTYRLRTAQRTVIATNAPFVPHCFDGICVTIEPGAITIRPGQHRVGEICFLKPDEPNRLSCVKWQIPAGHPIPEQMILRPAPGGRGGGVFEFVWRPEDRGRPKRVNIDLTNETGRREGTHLGVRSSEPVTVDFDIVSRSPGGDLGGRVVFEDVRGDVGVRIAPTRPGERVPRRVEIFGPIPAIGLELERDGAHLEGRIAGIPDHVTLDWQPDSQHPGTGRLVITPEGGSVGSLEVEATGVGNILPGMDRFSARLGPIGRAELSILPNGFDYRGDPVSGEVQVGPPGQAPRQGADCGRVSGAWYDQTTGAGRGCLDSVTSAGLTVSGTGVVDGHVATSGGPRPFDFFLRRPDGGTVAADMPARPPSLGATFDPAGRLEVRGPQLAEYPLSVTQRGPDGRPIVSIYQLRAPDGGGSVCWDAGPRCAGAAPPSTGASVSLTAPAGELRAGAFTYSGAFGTLQITQPSSTTGSFYWAQQGWASPRLGFDGTIAWDEMRLTLPPPAWADCRGATPSQCELRRILSGWASEVRPEGWVLSPAQLEAQNYSFDCSRFTLGDPTCSAGTITCRDTVNLRASGGALGLPLNWLLCSRTAPR
ncbi:MAG TPA: hypothetical protein VGF25_07990 [Thermoleophilaceae bacterium]